MGAMCTVATLLERFGKIVTREVPAALSGPCLSFVTGTLR